MKMLGIAIETPRYNPPIPSDMYVFLRQSYKPVNYRSVNDFPKSTPILVLAKSRGCTIKVVRLPAKPPFIILISK